ncbi:endonuclease domain-containing protein [Nonlabens antarcticus]|uniref:endonuclease domain-containing protein n=1 Tax=Nonlabens antarcticus TaxID=392714 RepID=UPI001891C75F|nr:endonuclease domain-containing protein [Nonlabens antarcticus]
MERRPHIHNIKYLEKNRKILRKKLTPAEAYLWSHIKSGQIDAIKFRRQYSINNFILDFYSAKFKLGIELDGDYHNEPDQFEKDEARDKELQSLGITILRYENKYIFAELQHVIADIKSHCSITKD